MESDTYKLLGTAVGHHGPYSFYKALKMSRKSGVDQIVAIGDFFFVKLWPDSELMAIGELQLLWTDRVSGKTLASLRLYFLPENTPAGRSHHGEDEVVAISERVVVRAEELLSWACTGAGGWPRGLRAAWAPPAAGDPPEPAPPPDHRLDFADINREKGLIADPEAACVVVFSYPRYCRYRAMLRRLEGLDGHWLRDPLVVALGGYAPPSNNTLILYCRETFEYPELEGHEFVCNHMAPRLKGRTARGRRRRARSVSKSSESDSETSTHRPATPQATRSSLRSSALSPPSPASADEEYPQRRGADTRADSAAKDKERQGGPEERAFMRRLRLFHQRREGGAQARALGTRGKELSLHRVYDTVMRAGGYDNVTRTRGWRRLLGSLGAVGHQATMARRNYERLLLPFEQSERRVTQQSAPSSNGVTGNPASTVSKPDRKKHLASITNNSIPIATIDISDSPIREISSSSAEKTPVPRLRTPPPGKRKSQEPKKMDTVSVTLQNGDKKGAETVKRKILEDKDSGVEEKKDVYDFKDDVILTKSDDEEEVNHEPPENDFDPSNILNLNIGKAEDCDAKEECDYVKVSRPAADLNQEFLDSLPGIPVEDTPEVEEPKRIISVVPPEKLMAAEAVGTLLNGTTPLVTPDKATPTRSRPSSLRSVRVKPDRRQGAASGSPPASALSSSNTPTVTPVPTPNPLQHPPSDDDLIEVPYRPKSPEIIDLDLYESPESPQSASKRKKLDILKRGGLEVTAVRGWPGLDPAFQQQILNQANFFQVYGAFAQGNADGYAPPKVTQAKSIYGTSSPEKTVYGNPKDPFMPPPHVLQGAAPRKAMCVQPPRADVLDLTVKPAVEIMRVPSGVPDQPQNLSAKKSTAPSPIGTDGNGEPRQINSALEITLVNKNHNSRINRTPQKRSSTGKFMSNKGQAYANSMSVPPLIPRNHIKGTSNSNSNSGLVIPNYQVSSTSNIGRVSPVNQSNQSLGSSVSSNLLQGAGGTLLQNRNKSSGSSTGAMPLGPLLDPSLYMSALYGSLAGQLAPGLTDHHLALYKELVAGRLGRYQGIGTPTSKN